MENQYKIIEANNPITFGSYKGWGLDEMFGADVFLAIKEIETFDKPFSEEVNEVHQSLLKMVKEAKRDFNNHYYAKKKNYWNNQKVSRSRYSRNKNKVFDYRLEAVKEYISERFPKKK